MSLRTYKLLVLNPSSVPASFDYISDGYGVTEGYLPRTTMALLGSRALR